MNKILSIFLVFLVSNSLSAQDKNGKVYFMRSEGFQAPAAPFNLFIDQKIVGKLRNKRFSIHDVKPGNHTFSTQFAGKNPNDKAEKMEVQIEAGRIYYIQVNFQHGIFKNKLHFKEVKEDDAKKVLPGLKELKN
jgi:hypothetical protein